MVEDACNLGKQEQPSCCIVGGHVRCGLKVHSKKRNNKSNGNLSLVLIARALLLGNRQSSQY